MTDFGSRFLVAPSLFPRRISGEAWGEESLTIELARERFRFEGLSPSQAASLRTRYGSRISDADGDVTLRVFRAPHSDFRAIDTRGWEYALDFAWDADAFDLAGMRLMARADLAAARAGVWTSVDDPAEFWGIAENILRPLLAARLLDRGGLLVHSAAVGSWLLPSPSGGGKSTIAKLALRAGLPVLSDDLNAVLRDDVFFLEPLPFTGDLDEHEVSTARAPLTALIKIEKGDGEELRALPLADAVSLLVRCAPYVNQDPRRMPRLLDRAAEIAAVVARAALTFRRDGDVWLYCLQSHDLPGHATPIGFPHPLSPIR